MYDGTGSLYTPVSASHEITTETSSSHAINAGTASFVNNLQNLTVNNDLAGGVLRFEKTPSGSINFVYSDSKNNIVYGSS